MTKRDYTLYVGVEYADKSTDYRTIRTDAETEEQILDAFDNFDLHDEAREYEGVIEIRNVYKWCTALDDGLADWEAVELAREVLDCRDEFEMYVVEGYFGMDESQIRDEYDLDHFIELVTEVDPSGTRYFLPGKDWDECARKCERGMVTDARGEFICYDAAVEYMDDELREELHDYFSKHPTVDEPGRYCTDQEFFDTYAEAHLERFGEEFVPYAGGDW